MLEAVLAAAREHGITVNRVSQGSGAMLLSESELREMSFVGAEAGVEVSLFVGPREGYGVGAHPRSADGAGHAGQLRGLRGLSYAIEDVARAVEAGIRSFLVADIGPAPAPPRHAGRRRAACRLRLEDLGRDGAVEPGRALVLAGLGATTSTSPPTSRPPSSPSCAPRRRSRSTSTSSRRTASAASSAATSSPSSSPSARRCTRSSACATPGRSTRPASTSSRRPSRSRARRSPAPRSRSSGPAASTRARAVRPRRRGPRCRSQSLCPNNRR